jgi:tetratricopeptide (TPR) repeat protein
MNRFVSYFFREPFSALKKREKGSGESLIWRTVFLFAIILSLIGLLVLAKDAGISGDEYFHVHHSKDVINYYKTLGEDKTAAIPTASNNLPYYSQSPDTFIHLLIDIFDVDNYIAWRHVLCNILAWIGILYSCLLARRIGGWRAAVLTCVLLILSPRFLGHSFNNLKDIPFATATVMSIYYILKFLNQLPKIKISTAIMLCISIAFATSVRVGGLLMVAYFGLFSIVYYISQRKNLKKVFFKTLLWSLGICVVAYILTVLTWPYAIEGPISNVYDSFTNMSKFQITIKQIFEGKMYFSDVLPWYYTPKYILITTPIVVLVGFILSIVFLKHNKKQWFDYSVLLFTALFPIFWIVLDNSNVYGGWRHLLFTYPSIVILSALGINTLIQLLKNRYAKYIVVAAFALLCVHPAAHSIRNHPYEYVYFNQFIGGTKNAYGEYEMDYYYHSLREAADWIKENAKKDSLTKGDKIVVGCWHIHPATYYFKDDTSRFKVEFIRWGERGNVDWDYAIVCTTGIYPEPIKNGTFPPQNTVHQVQVDGRPICVVLKRQHKYDLQGFEAFNAKDEAKAEEFYKKALVVDPLNETALIGLADMYMSRIKTDTLGMGYLYKATRLLDTFLEANPNHDITNHMKAYCQYMSGDIWSALATCDKAIAYNKKYEAPYILAAQLRLSMRDVSGAEDYLVRLLNTGMIGNELTDMLLEVFQYQGLNEANAYLKLYTMLEEFYRKKGDDEIADEYKQGIETIMQRMY